MDFNANKSVKLGVYRLTQDVVNPLGDKRHRHDWTRTKILRKGMTLKAEKLPFDTVADVVQLSGDGGSMLPGSDRHAELWAALSPNLEYVGPDRGSVTDELIRALDALLTESPNQTQAGDMARAALARARGEV